MTAAPAIVRRTETLRVALVGSPNAGKTTLFNALTGSSAKVGNYAGVTVERREGELLRAPAPTRILDLPGTYSLEGLTPDERIVTEVLLGRRSGEAAPDVAAAERYAREALARVPHWHYVRDILLPQIERARPR